MPRVVDNGENVVVGSELTTEQLEALQKASPTAEDILSNLDGLNEELSETYGVTAETNNTTVTNASPVGRPTGRQLRSQSKATPTANVTAAKTAQSRVEVKAEEYRRTMPTTTLEDELDALIDEVDSTTSTIANEAVAAPNIQDQILPLI